MKDEVRLRQLPLNGRLISSLFDLTPGVEGGANPRVNGLKVGSVEILLDGVSLVDRFGGGIRYDGVLDLPFGRGKRFGGDVPPVVQSLIGGWRIAVIGDWRSGLWSSVSPSLYLFGDPAIRPDQRLVMTVFGRTQRLWFRGYFDPTQASNVSQQALQALVPLNRSDRILRPVGPAFDNRLSQQLANGAIRLTTIEDAVNPNARAFYLGPGSWNVDISVGKSFTVNERVNARFSADFFNVFNHPNDVDPDMKTGLQDLSVQLNEPRIIQLSLRIGW